jgi:cell wall-associated NlpC family hydrolase
MRYGYAILIPIIISCRPDGRQEYASVMAERHESDTASYIKPKDSLLSEKIVAFAKTLLGTPYKYGCAAPSTGFDCSGFINYVFNHFNVTVPRSSVEFTNVGITIELRDAKPGDLILFTGTDNSIRTAGHIGIIVSNDENGISFIHSSSGKEMAVTITPLNDYYMARFMKVIRYVE